MKKNIIYIALLVLLGGIFFIPGIKDLFFPIAEIEKVVKIEDSDYDVQLKGINVPSTNLKNFKNKKLVFLNFWGIWCAPCREEWPTIQKLYDSKKDKVDFVLIAMMDKEDAVRKFLQENKYTVPVYIAESPINDRILPKVFPTTLILDAQGRILMKEDATKDWNSDSIHSFLNSFLN